MPSKKAKTTLVFFYCLFVLSPMDQENKAIIIEYFACIIVLTELKILYNDTSGSLFSCQPTEEIAHKKLRFS